MAVAVGNVARVTYWQRLFGQRILSVFHMRCTVAPAAGTTSAQAMINLATRMGNTGMTPLVDWIPLVTGDVNFDEVRAQLVFPAREVYQKDAIGTTGTGTGNPNTANIAVSIEKRSLHPGRKGVGRWQIAGTAANLIVGGMVDATYLTALQGLGNDLIGDVSVVADSSKWRFCLFGGAAVTSDDDIFDVQAKDTARTMHRRTLRVGE